MRIFNGPTLPFKKKADPIRFRMEKSDTGQSAEIYIYDVIGDSWEGTTAKQFSADLKELGKPKTLNIFINSPGGVVFDGVAIYNALRRHPAHKNVHIDGVAASIASVVAMAGDEIQMAANGMMMLHDPWGFVIGRSKDMRDAADRFDKIRDTLIGTYASRSGSKDTQIAEWMDAETWFSADEAIAAGLADSITKEVAAAALAVHDLSEFQNVPRSLKALMQQHKESNPPAPTPEPEKETNPAGTSPARHPALDRAAAHLRRRHLTGPALS